MNAMLPVTGLPAAPIPLGRDPAAAVLAAANLLLPHLERGQPVDTAMLRAAMETAFDAPDASGAWDWKLAYEAGEVATVLFLRKYGKALFRKAASPAARLSVLAKIAALLPTHSRRSEVSQAMQQFSTPLPLGVAALTAAAITPADIVQEPSAGTGLLAILAEIAGRAPILNERADTRAELLGRLFPAVPVTRFDAAQIDDHLVSGAVPSVVLMNPPFSALANVAGRVADAGLRHVASALARLAPGGRLVAITGANVGPDLPDWHVAFVRLQATGTVVFTATVAGSVYAKHGTSFATRLTVIDKRPADDAASLPPSAGMAPDVPTLLGWIGRDVPLRLAVALIRPMEAHGLPLHALADSHWPEVDRAAFVAAWEAELAEVPAFADSTFHMVAGLLLPIWKRLPNESTRVYRLQADDGQRIIGRRVSAVWAATALATGAPSLGADQAYAALIEGRTVIDLAEGLQLRRVRVMASNRIELTGFTEAMRERLRAWGLFTEIISWKLRFFVPVSSDGPIVLGRLLDTYAIARIAEREAA